MSPGSSTESYPAFARIGLRENPGKNLNLSRPGFEPGLPGFAARRADRYSTDVDIFMYLDILIFIAAQRLFRHHYNIHRNNPIPSAYAIRTWIQNFEETDSALRKKSPDDPTSSSSCPAGSVEFHSSQFHSLPGPLNLLSLHHFAPGEASGRSVHSHILINNNKMFIVQNESQHLKELRASDGTNLKYADMRNEDVCISCSLPFQPLIQPIRGNETSPERKLNGIKRRQYQMKPITIVLPRTRRKKCPDTNVGRSLESYKGNTWGKKNQLMWGEVFGPVSLSRGCCVWDSPQKDSSKRERVELPVGVRFPAATLRRSLRDKRRLSSAIVPLRSFAC
ncbi:hypothetical protein ANN_13354 [Periplaneta americana]|uniref:Uncharacterized protein n=1 Tax=Periplaneta americana TaxID=6978 RepID=A0ABQ8TLR5_PERAM|nr:hypothetical protein ANN_13354 [Periplaneta americana]